MKRRTFLGAVAASSAAAVLPDHPVEAREPAAANDRSGAAGPGPMTWRKPEDGERLSEIDIGPRIELARVTEVDGLGGSRVLWSKQPWSASETRATAERERRSEERAAEPHAPRLQAIPPDLPPSL